MITYFSMLAAGGLARKSKNRQEEPAAPLKQPLHLVNVEIHDQKAVNVAEIALMALNYTKSYRSQYPPYIVLYA